MASLFQSFVCVKRSTPRYGALSGMPLPWVDQADQGQAQVPLLRVKVAFP